MEEEIDLILDMAEESMKNAYTHLEEELTKIRAGKANPILLDSVKVEYYGSQVPLSQVANVNSLDPRTLTVQPWEKGMIEPIERGIINSNLGFAPQNNGESIIISIPALTEDRRKSLCKQARAEGETAKISIRNSRKEANDNIKKLQKDGYPEDGAKIAEENVQKQTDAFIKNIDALVVKKESDIMTI